MKEMFVVVAGLLCGREPAFSQQPVREQPQSHAHGAHGHVEDVRSVLRMLAVYQMRFRAQHGRYAASLRELGLAASDRVVVRITTNGADGFTAVSASDAEECAIFSGRIASPRDYAPRPDEITCRRVGGRSP